MKAHRLIKNILTILLMLSTILQLTACNNNILDNTSTKESNSTQTNSAEAESNILEAQSQTSTEKEVPDILELTNHKIATLDEEHFEQFVDYLTDYALIGGNGTRFYTDVVKKLGKTHSVVLSEDRAYLVYKTSAGGKAYLSFWRDVSPNAIVWLFTNAFYIDEVRSYEEFSDLVGKTADDVEKIDSSVNYYRPESESKSSWQSVHYLEDGLLVITYNKNNIVEKIHLEKDRIFEREDNYFGMIYPHIFNFNIE